MIVDLYKARVLSLLIGWAASAGGFLLLLPMVMTTKPTLVNSVVGLVVLSAFFAMRIRSVLKAGPQDNDIHFIEQQP